VANDLVGVFGFARVACDDDAPALAGTGVEPARFAGDAHAAGSCAACLPGQGGISLGADDAFAAFDDTVDRADGGQGVAGEDDPPEADVGERAERRVECECSSAMASRFRAASRANTWVADAG
jgi:hypothetical protein